MVNSAPADPELDGIVADEQRTLDKVSSHLKQRAAQGPTKSAFEPDYEALMIDLRDQMASARLEDIPPLLEQMERLQSLANRKRESQELTVDVRSPYFGHLVLEENKRKREVLIGRGTYLDAESGVRIVDWRDAPVSRLYYRYEEGDEYDEVFGDREVTGQVHVRRSVTIVETELRRIGCPQGSFLRTRTGGWRRQGADAARLQGGQGSALRAEQQARPKSLGVGADGDGREDKSLREITALIDARQFELISKPESGLVVIQGGAGSGKTTIGLHRMAYLAYQDKRRFRPDKMLVVVFNDALARYIQMVLPALDVEGVPIRTYEGWASKLRTSHVPRLPRVYSDETPTDVTRFKKHPAMLVLIEEKVAQIAARLELELEKALAHAQSESELAAAETVRAAWKRMAAEPVAHRVHAVASAMKAQSGALPIDARVSLERLTSAGLKRARDVISAWAELVTDQELARAVFARENAGMSEGELRRALTWCSDRTAAVLAWIDDRNERAEDASERAEGAPEGEPEQRSSEEDGPEQDFSTGVDGRDLDDVVTLDREDDTLLLRLVQRLRGPLMRPGKAKEALVYEHVLIDEAQDLSPVELAVVFGCVSKARSITLAGDVAQRLYMDNGFTDWKSVLGNLGLAHVEVEPLKLTYRSTKPITAFAYAVLGPLSPAELPLATRDGVPVEVVEFAHSGDTVSFLAEALRELAQLEPLASVAIISRFPEQADIYFEGLRKAEVPRLRRIADQDFPFKPGIDVTDVKQVKGLEFDYVVLVEVSDAGYPTEDEARHLLHIGATRAAHQLWVLTSGRPSRLIPDRYFDGTP